jgi:hypothetical protein
LGQVLNNEKELMSPQELHPIFYGCFDWHSSVHGHWLLIAISKKYGNQLPNYDSIRAILNEQFNAEKIEKEIDFFRTKFNDSFERTYGWAWMLKLQLELDTWEDPMAQNWSLTLRPLTNMIVEKYKIYLPKLNYPIRTGEHVNTAFGLCFAFDYALNKNDTSFIHLIGNRAKEFYLMDSKYPLRFEPSGYDFLSPALEEADLMRRVLDEDEFQQWITRFLPELRKKHFQLEPGKVSDRSDGKLVHLDGLNFSRAWCLLGIAESNKRFAHLTKVAENHIRYSLPSITDGDYMGEHWLASFAVYALLNLTGF